MSNTPYPIIIKNVIPTLLLIFIVRPIYGMFIFPQICGKRKRVKLDGSQQIKVHLEKSAQINTETKLDTFMAVYKKLTGKDVVFEYVD